MQSALLPILLGILGDLALRHFDSHATAPVECPKAIKLPAPSLSSSEILVIASALFVAFYIGRGRGALTCIGREYTWSWRVGLRESRAPLQTSF